MNNYQAQEFNSTIMFITSIVMMGFMVGMVKMTGSDNPKQDKKLVEVAIERRPLEMAKQFGYDVHRLSPKDIVDKGDYIRGYRFRLSKAKPGEFIPEVILARSEEEVSTFLKVRELPGYHSKEGNPMEIERYHGQIVQVGDARVKVSGLPDWSLEYIEYPQGKMPEYRGALMKERMKIVKVTNQRIYFEQ